MTISYLGTLFFALALIHTFCVSYFAEWSKKYEKGSVLETFLHLLSEVEIVFGFWAFLFLSLWATKEGLQTVIDYQQSLNLTEPLFIFCIMILASTRPMVRVALSLILFVSRKLSQIIPLNPILVQFFILFTLGPLIGSLITEPAAITIVALLLYRMIDIQKIDSKLLYGLLALMFVNISVGGALTHFAAPPILIVARVWNWSLQDVFMYLGEAAISAVLINTTLFIFVMNKKIISMLKPMSADHDPIPKWVIATHLMFLISIVLTSHYSQVFVGLFLIFIGLTTVTQKYQDALKFREALLVGFFLGGLIVFGSFQKWWLDPLIQSLNEKSLYLGAIGLTAITDNAALTYLGSQVIGITEPSKWALVSGALVGGGLSILANAPNPAGFSILSSKFANSTLNGFKLFLAALPFTIIAGLCFYFLGHF
jgi:hypothetical protein